MRHPSFIVLFGFLSSLSCRDHGVEPPPAHIPTIALSAQSVSITEAELRIRFTDSASAHSFSLFRDRQFFTKVINSPRDTIVADTTLLRGRNYTYKAYRLRDSVVIDSSLALAIHTIDSASITLNVEPFVTEAAIGVTINDRNPIRGYNISRNGQTFFTATLTGRDTAVIDTELSPGTNYTYKVYRLNDPAAIDSSTPLSFATLSPTTHNWTFFIDTLGDGNSSALYDVSIIDQNNVWAVGEVYLRDSTGQDYLDAYNVVRWDGLRWNLIRVMFPICGSNGTAPFPSRTIFTYSLSDIWVTSAGTLAHWDGSTFSTVCVPSDILNGAVVKMWCSISRKLFLVGDLGMVLSYDGANWQKLESGTDVRINDVWGDTQLPNNDLQVLAAATSQASGGEMKLLSITPALTVDTVPWSPQRELYSVWFKGRSRVFTAGAGMFTGRNGIWQRIAGLPNTYTRRVRGLKANNVFVVGDFGSCAHYNGVDWRFYPEAYLPTGAFEGLAVSDNFMVAVGDIGTQAIVIRGYRN